MESSNKLQNTYLHIFSSLNETSTFFCLFTVGYLVPFLLGGPQIVLGSIVNATLVVSALKLKRTELILPLLLAPSLGAISRGVVFGPLTPYLLMMVPAIWLGNAILVFGMRKFASLKKGEEKKYWITLGASVSLKTLFLFGTSAVLVGIGLLPQVFLVSMGAIQLFTAAIGGICAYVALKAAMRFE